MKIIKHLINSINAIFYYIKTYFCKKDEKLWVFGAWKGNNYSDNSKYLYEYVTNHEKKINAIWITKNEKIYETLNKQNKKVQLWPTKEAKKTLEKASVIIQTEGNRDVGQYRPGNCLIIQLWHGIPIKKLDWYKNYSALKRRIIEIEGDNHKKSIWFSPSKYYSDKMKELWNIPEKNIILAGYPRNDSFFQQRESQVLKKIKKDFPKHKYYIYLPTHRNFGKDFDVEFVLSGLIKLEKTLIENNIMLLYKPHFNETKILKEAIKNKKLKFKKIIIADSEEYSDVYEYLHGFDCLISDYSSIIYDFLVTKKPIILFNYDLDKYSKQDAGIFEEYYKYKVGPFCDNWEELADNIKIFSQKDTWYQKRERCRKIINQFNDGNNCKRVTAEITKIIERK